MATKGDAVDATHVRGADARRHLLRAHDGGAALELEAMLRAEADDLHEDFLPFWAAHGIDAEYGGFICGLTHEGRVVDDSKVGAQGGPSCPMLL